MVTQAQIATLKTKIEGHIKDLQEVDNATAMISERTINAVTIQPTSIFKFTTMTQAELDAYHTEIVARIAAIKATM